MKLFTGLAALGLAAVGALAAAPAHACSCSPPPPACEALWHTSVVFSGEVTAMADQPGHAQLVTFKVDETFRGQVKGTVMVRGGGVCGAVVCSDNGVPCAASPECCSGVCGPAGTCAASCIGTGSACTDSSQCCSLTCAGGECINDVDCPAGYTCQPFAGIVFQLSCQILCTQDCECPAGYTCYVHADSKVGSGSCLLKSEASSLATACRDFLISKRRYSVKATRVAFPQEGAVGAGQLQLVPRTHALRTTPVDGCSSDAQCGALADYAAQLVDNTHPRLSTAKDAHVIKVGDAEQSLWKCQLDATRAPPGGVAGAKRCVLSCRTDVDCDAGESCSAGVCVEGVVPPPACATAVQAYDVRASDAFVVIGTDSGYVHPWVAAKPLTGPTTQCVRRTGDGVERFLGRVPLTAPACDGSGTSPNPCSTTVAHSELAPRYQAGSDTCALDPGYVQPFLRERTDVPAIRFSNQGMTLTVVDPYTPGDAACINDRGGVPGAQGAKIPIAFAGYQILFHQTNGYAAMAMPLVAPVFPVKVLRGPTDSIWVMDAGDTLSSVTASTRGKVYRIESSALDVVNIVK